MKTRQEAIIDYLDNFPLIKNNGKNKWVSVEWLGGAHQFSISDNPSGNGGVIKEMFGGGKIIDYSFVFQAQFERTTNVMTMLENTGFFEQLAKWLVENNTDRILPVFDDERKALSIKVQQTPYIYLVSEDGTQATYAMGIVLRYLGKY